MNTKRTEPDYTLQAHVKIGNGPGESHDFPQGCEEEARKWVEGRVKEYKMNRPIPDSEAWKTLGGFQAVFLDGDDGTGSGEEYQARTVGGKLQFEWR